MSKNEKEFTARDTSKPVRRSEYSPEREACMDEDGNYTYCQWVRNGNGGWELKSTCTVRIGEEGVTSELVFALNDLDREDDRRDERTRRHRDKVFEARCAAYEADSLGPNGEKLVDPWEKVSYRASGERDLLDELLSSEKPADARMAKLLELMDGLTDDQLNLIYDHLGARKQFTQIAAEESARTGKPVSRQAISNRWDRILTKLCKGFGVPKPVRRRDKEETE